MGLDSGEALVAVDGLRALRDQLYALEAALDDVEHDLRGRPSPADYRDAFRHLYAAAAQLRGAGLEPIAVLRQDDLG
jgi:hypothetical protein